MTPYTYRKQQTEWTGRLEGLLARHWPELTALLPLGSVTLLGSRTKEADLLMGNFGVFLDQLPSKAEMNCACTGGS